METSGKHTRARSDRQVHEYGKWSLVEEKGIKGCSSLDPG